MATTEISCIFAEKILFIMNILDEILHIAMIQQLDEDINKILNEELGISDEVVNVTNLIFDKIIKEYKSKKYKNIIPHGKGIYEYQGYFIETNVFGHNLTIEYSIFNFNDRICREEYIAKNGNGYLNAGSNFRYLGKGENRKLVSNKIMIVLEAISGDIINEEDALDSPQHELEHMFQQSSMDKEFGNLNLYRQVSSNLYSKNKFKHNVALVLYMSFKSEIEGYANGLYAYVKQRLKENPINVNQIFRDSAAYQKLQQMYTAKNFIKANINDKRMDNAFYEYKRFGIQKQKINKTIEKTIKEMLTRFGKALVKTRKDSLKQGVMREGIRYPF